MTMANILQMIGVGDYDASNLQANLAISICPILSGKNAGSTHMVYTNDEKGIINRGKRRETDGPRVEVVQSMKKSVITWISAYLEEVHRICPNDIYKVRHCFSIAAQLTSDDRSLRNFDPATGHMTIYPRNFLNPRLLQAKELNTPANYVRNRAMDRMTLISGLTLRKRLRKVPMLRLLLISTKQSN